MDRSLELVTFPVSGPSEIEDYPWGRFFLLEDPDRNRWSIQQPPGIGA